VHGPLFRAAHCEVGVPWALAGRTVDEFAQDVRVPQVVGTLGDDMDQNLMQGDVTPLLRPPGHHAGGIRWQGLDGGIAVCGGEPVQLDDVLPALVSGRPQICVGACARLQPRKVASAGTVENYTK
jgi:hypothetical protein